MLGYCTIVNNDINAFVMLLSFAINNPNSNIIVCCSTTTYNYINKSTPNIYQFINIEFLLNDNKNIHELIMYVLESYSKAVYIDCNTIICNKYKYNSNSSLINILDFKNINKNTISINIYCAIFNPDIKTALKNNNFIIPLLCLDRIEYNGNWIIQIPYYSYNEQFKELCYILENKFTDIKIINDKSLYIWLSQSKYVLLYDQKTLESFNTDKEVPFILLGNGSYQDEIKKLEENKFKIKPFIFWAKYPYTLEKFILNKSKTYKERTFNTIFIGNIKSSYTESIRHNIKDWKDSIDYLWIINSNDYMFEYEEYLEKIANSRFGLSFEGYGKKCNRDIELMALGTVMLRFGNVNVDCYYEKLIENKHYININEKADINKIISSISEKKWNYMSNECKNWYYRNCHSDNTLNVWFKSIAN